MPCRQVKSLGLTLVLNIALTFRINEKQLRISYVRAREKNKKKKCSKHSHKKEPVIFCFGCVSDIQLFQLRLSRRQGKRSNMSAKGLSGKTSFIPEYITIHRFSTKFKIRSCFLMNINRDYVSLETKFCSVCVSYSSKLFALVFDFSALLGDNLN